MAFPASADESTQKEKPVRVANHQKKRGGVVARVAGQEEVV